MRKYLQWAVLMFAMVSGSASAQIVSDTMDLMWNDYLAQKEDPSQCGSLKSIAQQKYANHPKYVMDPNPFGACTHKKINDKEFRTIQEVRIRLKNAPARKQDDGAAAEKKKADDFKKREREAAGMKAANEKKAKDWCLADAKRVSVCSCGKYYPNREKGGACSK